MSEQYDDHNNHYPTEPHGSIPAFHNEDEEAEFFDTHDFGDFWAEGRPVAFRHTLEKKVQLRLNDEMDHELSHYAEEAGMKKATLIRQWLKERLRQEREKRAS